jgi:hypothetical protein
LELAGAQNPSEVAKEVRKWLTTSRAPDSSWTGKTGGPWSRTRNARRAIIDQVAKADPAKTLELIWRFMALANAVFSRCDDSGGTVIGNA